MLVLRYFSFAADMGDEFMRLRKQALGDRNLIGARVELARKNQGMKQKRLAGATAGKWSRYERLRFI